ncbi:MAG: DNA gyrase subunit A [Candidatus Magasanikbacteria bacterium]
MSEDKSQKEAAEIRDAEITDELQDSYLDYAMSVIVSRALPDMRDGLKPVQRRILWAMWNMGLDSSSAHKKSARVVGKTMGVYHPHGDKAVYDTLVRMAQDFSLRYPLVDGQGNFGNVDGDSAAAQRYTEAKLEAISEEMLEDIEKDTVEWSPNYDNTQEEPDYLPAKLPNLVLNGTMGIAVGMATNIPPHNLTETVEALKYLAKNEDATVSELMEYIQAPDFPTGGVVYDQEKIEEAYSTGRGSVTIRAKTEIEETEGKSGPRIAVTEIPFQVTKSKLIKKTAKLVKDDKLNGVKNIRDESGREGLRIVLELKQGANPQRILNSLFKHTRFQKKFHFNMVALEDGIQPKVVSLKDLLAAYLKHRKKVVRRRAEYKLSKAEDRAHVLEGLVSALDEIDKVIETIKSSEDRSDAQQNLMENFDLTERQSDAILKMRLQTLASLAAKKLKDELKEKKELIEELNELLDDPEKIKEEIIEELEELKEKYGDERKTQIVEESVEEFSQEDFIPQKETVILLTKEGYIKRVSPTSFKVQKRGGQGIIGFDLKEEDTVENFALADTHDDVLFFSDKGQVFQTKVYDIPKGKRTTKGSLIDTFLGVEDNENITSFITCSLEDNEQNYLVMATENGTIKKTPMEEFENIQSNGIKALSLDSSDKLLWAGISNGECDIILTTKNGKAIRFSEDEVRPMGRGAAGVKAADLKNDDKVVGVDVITKKGKNERLLVVTEKGYGKQTEIDDYSTQKRGGVGVKTAQVSDDTGPVAATKLVDDSVDQLLAFSAKGQVIKMGLEDIQISSRDTRGVKVMELQEGDTLSGFITL